MLHRAPPLMYLIHLAYPISVFSVPPRVRVPQVRNRWFRVSSLKSSLLWNSAHFIVVNSRKASVASYRKVDRINILVLKLTTFERQTPPKPLPMPICFLGYSRNNVCYSPAHHNIVLISIVLVIVVRPRFDSFFKPYQRR